MAGLSQPLLVIDRVAVAYGGAEVVRDVSLTIAAGEIVALVGPNGAGKTTLFRAISGLIPARHGSILLSGTSIERLATYRIARLGLTHVPEGRMVFGDQTVEDNLLLGAFARHFRGQQHEIRRDAETLMARFPILGQRRHQLAGLLSGGEQQQLAIARGLMARPRLLLLDEPSLGLAPGLMRQVFSSLTDLCQAGVAVLVADQHASLALEVATRGYVIRGGQVRLEGPSRQLLDDPSLVGEYLSAARRAGSGSPATNSAGEPDVMTDATRRP